MVKTILKFDSVASRIIPDNQGPRNPAKNPYAVKTIPNTFPKFSNPKTSVTKGAETVKSPPNARPTKQAKKLTKIIDWVCGITKYAIAAIR